MNDYQASFIGLGVTVETPSSLSASNGQMPSWNTDGTFAGWVTATAPAGASGTIQYNNAGAFGDVTGSSWSGSLLTLPATTISGTLTVNSVSDYPLTLQRNGVSAFKVTSSAGQVISYYDEGAYVITQVTSGGNFSITPSGGLVTVSQLAVSDLTATRIPYVGASGRLVDSATLLTDGSQIKAGSGSASAPTYSFVSGTTTGMYLGNTSTIYYSLGGVTSQFHISPSGPSCGDGVLSFGTGVGGTNDTFIRRNSVQGILLNTTAITGVPLGINLASGQSADAIQVTSSGGTAGDKFKVSASGQVTTASNVICGDSVIATYVVRGNSYLEALNQVRIGNSGSIVQFAPGTGVWDAGVARNAAGVIEVNTGTAGVYGGIKLGSVQLRPTVVEYGGLNIQRRGTRDWEISNGTIDGWASTLHIGGGGSVYLAGNNFNYALALGYNGTHHGVALNTPISFTSNSDALGAADTFLSRSTSGGFTLNSTAGNPLTVQSAGVDRFVVDASGQMIVRNGVYTIGGGANSMTFTAADPRWSDLGGFRNIYLFDNASAPGGRGCISFGVTSTVDVTLQRYSSTALSVNDNTGYSVGSSPGLLDFACRSIGLGGVPSGVAGGISGASIIRLGTTTNDAVLTLGNATLQFGYYGNGTNRMYLSGGVMYFGSQHIIGWSSTNADATTGTFTALARNAEGIVEVNNGTAGQWRDLKARYITATAVGGADCTFTSEIPNGSYAWRCTRSGQTIASVYKNDGGPLIFESFAIAGTTAAFKFDAATTINAASGNPLTVQRNGVNALVIDSTSTTTITGTIVSTAGVVGDYFNLGNSGSAPILRYSTKKIIQYTTSGATAGSYAISPVLNDSTGASATVLLDSSGSSYFTGGNVGVGISSPSALIHGIKTTEQLRLGYDSANYVSWTVASNGDTTAAITTGTTTNGFSFSNPISCPGAGTNSQRFGTGSAAAGGYSCAFGVNASSSAIGSVAIGYQTLASSTSAIALGNQSQATGGYSIAFGESAVAGNTAAFAFGYGATTTAANQFLLGSTAAPINAMKLITDGVGGSLNFGVTSGNLTITPSGYKTTVVGNSSQGLSITNSGNANAINLFCGSSSANLTSNCDLVFGPSTGLTYLYTGGVDSSFRLYNGASTQTVTMAISSGGNLTITPSGGTTTVVGDIVSAVSSTAGSLQFANVNHGIRRVSGTNNVEVHTSGGNLYFSANGLASNQMTLTSSGTFGIGITPTAQLHVLGSVGSKVQTLESTATNDNPTLDVYQNRVTTTDATVTTLHTIAITDETAVLVTVTVLARRTGGVAGAAGDSATYVRRAKVKRTGGGIAVIGTVDAPWTDEDQAGWDCTIDVDGGNNARVRVTGAVDNNVTWHLVKLEVSPLST